MRFTDVLNFIRWKNLLMLILVQVLIKYVLFINVNADTKLNNLYFLILVASTVFIAAAGYVINDINDVTADKINKPKKVLVGLKISRTAANELYSVLNFTGLALGMLLSFLIGKFSFFIVFIIVSLLLYQYSTSLKNKFLTGNFIISFLIFLSLLIIALYDIVPATHPDTQNSQMAIFVLVAKIGFFAFLLTFLREIVKDIEDIVGDRQTGAETLPVKLGIEKTKMIIMAVSTFSIAVIFFFNFSYFPVNSYGFYYLTGFVILPLFFFIFKTRKAHNQEDFHYLSNILKYIMLAGILTIIFL